MIYFIIILFTFRPTFSLCHQGNCFSVQSALVPVVLQRLNYRCFHCWQDAETKLNILWPIQSHSPNFIQLVRKSHTVQYCMCKNSQTMILGSLPKFYIMSFCSSKPLCFRGYLSVGGWGVWTSLWVYRNCLHFDGLDLDSNP